MKKKYLSLFLFIVGLFNSQSVFSMDTRREPFDEMVSDEGHVIGDDFVKEIDKLFWKMIGNTVETFGEFSRGGGGEEHWVVKEKILKDRIAELEKEQKCDRETIEELKKKKYSGSVRYTASLSRLWGDIKDVASQMSRVSTHLQLELQDIFGRKEVNGSLKSVKGSVTGKIGVDRIFSPFEKKLEEVRKSARELSRLIKKLNHMKPRMKKQEFGW